LQATWKHLIRVLLSAEGRPTSNDAIREYQVSRLGREGGQDCILELLPLPSPGLNRWAFYPDTEIPYLKTRELYGRHVAPLRVTHLRSRIAKHRPRAVVFYGSGYAHWWGEIAEADFRSSGVDTVSIAQNGETLYVIMHHPAARGRTGAYFEAVGRLIAGLSRG
jgi:hypothetical protein